MKTMELVYRFANHERRYELKAGEAAAQQLERRLAALEGCAAALQEITATGPYGAPDGDACYIIAERALDKLRQTE